MSVRDLNDVPTDVGLAGSLSLPESSSARTFVGSVDVVDEDVNQTYQVFLLNVTAGYNSIAQNKFRDFS